MAKETAFDALGSTIRKDSEFAGTFQSLADSMARGNLQTIEQQERLWDQLEKSAETVLPPEVETIAEAIDRDETRRARAKNKAKLFAGGHKSTVEDLGEADLSTAEGREKLAVIVAGTRAAVEDERVSPRFGMRGPMISGEGGEGGEGAVPEMYGDLRTEIATTAAHARQHESRARVTKEGLSSHEAGKRLNDYVVLSLTNPARLGIRTLPVLLSDQLAPTPVFHYFEGISSILGLDVQARAMGASSEELRQAMQKAPLGKVVEAMMNCYGLRVNIQTKENRFIPVEYSVRKMADILSGNEGVQRVDEQGMKLFEYHRPDGTVEEVSLAEAKRKGYKTTDPRLRGALTLDPLKRRNIKVVEVYDLMPDAVKEDSGGSKTIRQALIRDYGINPAEIISLDLQYHGTLMEASERRAMTINNLVVQRADDPGLTLLGHGFFNRLGQIYQLGRDFRYWTDEDMNDDILLRGEPSETRSKKNRAKEYFRKYQITSPEIQRIMISHYSPLSGRKADFAVLMRSLKGKPLNPHKEGRLQHLNALMDQETPVLEPFNYSGYGENEAPIEDAKTVLKNVFLGYGNLDLQLYAHHLRGNVIHDLAVRQGKSYWEIMEGLEQDVEDRLSDLQVGALVNKKRIRSRQEMFAVVQGMTEGQREKIAQVDFRNYLVSMLWGIEILGWKRDQLTEKPIDDEHFMIDNLTPEEKREYLEFIDSLDPDEFKGWPGLLKAVEMHSLQHFDYGEQDKLILKQIYYGANEGDLFGLRLQLGIDLLQALDEAYKRFIGSGILKAYRDRGESLEGVFIREISQFISEATEQRDPEIAARWLDEVKKSIATIGASYKYTDADMLQIVMLDMVHMTKELVGTYQRKFMAEVANERFPEKTDLPSTKIEPLKLNLGDNFSPEETLDKEIEAVVKGSLPPEEKRKKIEELKRNYTAMQVYRSLGCIVQDNQNGLEPIVATDFGEPLDQAKEKSGEAVYEGGRWKWKTTKLTEFEPFAPYRHKGDEHGAVEAVAIEILHDARVLTEDMRIWFNKMYGTDLKTLR